MECGAAVIAGGKSTRFGSSKQLALICGETLLERAVKLARSISSDVSIVTSKRIELPEHGCKVIYDLVEDVGPIVGIYTALIHASMETVAIVPCDLPLLVPRIYRALIAQTGGEAPVVARSHRGMEPLVSVWPRCADERLREELYSGERSLRVVLRRLNCTEIDVTNVLPGYDPDWFSNVNTQSDLERLAERFRVTNGDGSGQ